MVTRLEIAIRPDLQDPRGVEVARKIRSHLGLQIRGVRTREVYRIDAELTDDEPQRVLREFVDPALQQGALGGLPDEPYDVAVAVGRLREDGFASRVAVIDCDLHQGNGTAHIFAGEADVFTFSIHQENNYPLKERSDLDIGLPDGADDALYLKELSVIDDMFDRHGPDIVFYLAGADPYVGDQLGGLALTREGLRRRDRLVFEVCRARGLPVAAVFAGGYAADVMDDVEIHLGTIEEALRALSGGRKQGPKKVEPEP